VQRSSFTVLVYFGAEYSLTLFIALLAHKSKFLEMWATYRNASTLADEVLDGLDGGADTSVVGDLLAVEGHVEVAADQDL
jgi:hypothetical protein